MELAHIQHVEFMRDLFKMFSSKETEIVWSKILRWKLQRIYENLKLLKPRLAMNVFIES